MPLKTYNFFAYKHKTNITNIYNNIGKNLIQVQKNLLTFAA